MSGHDPIAYTYEADHHCPDCTLERFGAVNGFIAMQDADGISPCLDRHGNPVAVIAPWDEWEQFNGESETLACGTCGAILDTYDPEVEEAS